MATLTDIEVAIGGNIIKISGYESEEYIQRVASYVNNKLNEFNKLDAYKRISSQNQQIYIQLNIADDFFKAKNQIVAQEEELRNNSKEISNLKHDLVNNQMKTKNLEDNLKKVTEEKKNLEKKISELNKTINELNNRIKRQERKS